ncbi:MAG: 50S ribosomal protein L32 [Acidobacteriota bacterium]
MANPKRRHSRSRTGKRRAHDHLPVPSVSVCPRCNETKLPHRVCLHCGYYKGREVIEVAEV